jgi:hypothetical protein
MSEAIELLIHFIVSAIKLLKPGGVKVVMAESMAMKQQLIVMNRGKKKSPKLVTSDRFLFGLLAVFIGGSRLKKIAVIIKPATILAFHKSLVNRKYNRLYSNNTKKKPGRKPQAQVLIDLVIEMKKRNPSFGYCRISMQILEAFGIAISRFAVGRTLRKNKHKLPSGNGRVVKKLMRLPSGNISTAHLSVLCSRLVRQVVSSLSWRLEITIRCLYLDDFVRHDNGRGTRGVHVLTMFHQIESASINTHFLQISLSAPKTDSNSDCVQGVAAVSHHRIR